MLEINQIHHGDCLELMQDIKDKSVDMILCDLPYGTTACSWDTIIPLKELWNQYERIIKDDGAIVLTASQPFSSILVTSKIDMFRYEIVWDKVKPSNFQMMNFQVGRIHESILVFSKKPAVFCKGNHMVYYPQKTERNRIRKTKKTFYGSNNSTLRKGHSIKDLGEVEYVDKHPTSIICYSNSKTANRLHPTEKPINLFKYLIKTYTKKGELVLDNCIGSGTTAVACKQLSRRFIGIDKEKKYVEISKKRLSQETLLPLDVKQEGGNGIPPTPKGDGYPA